MSKYWFLLPSYVLMFVPKILIFILIISIFILKMLFQIPISLIFHPIIILRALFFILLPNHIQRWACAEIEEGDSWQTPQNSSGFCQLSNLLLTIALLRFFIASIQSSNCPIVWVSNCPIAQLLNCVSVVLFNCLIIKICVSVQLSNCPIVQLPNY